MRGSPRTLSKSSKEPQILLSGGRPDPDLAVQRYLYGVVNHDKRVWVGQPRFWVFPGYAINRTVAKNQILLGADLFEILIHFFIIRS